MSNDADALIQYADSGDTDLIAYSGPISREGYDQLCDVLSTPRRSHCLFVLATLGGDAHAGFRIARALSHHYPKPGQIRVLVPHLCKSAGTLICIGAHELIIADCGELGPLDVQVQKPDELWQLASGLDIIRGLVYLRRQSLDTFREYLIDINEGSGLSTAIASEIASKLTIGMFTPIFAQIDPIKLGEMEAALAIATDYGVRLNERSHNLQGTLALQKLVVSYPSHNFAIDRKEARQLFVNVRPPEGNAEKLLCNIVRQFFERNFDRLDVYSVLNRIEAHLAQTSAPPQEDENGENQTDPGGIRAAPDAAPRDQQPVEPGNEDHRATGESEQLRYGNDQA